MTREKVPHPTLEDHEKAFTEVSFLLSIFASTVDDLMGGATASVGRIAGRNMARKLPIYLPEPSLCKVLGEVAGHMKHGFEISSKCDEKGANLKFGHCVIREACKVRGIEPGDSLCKLFHSYLDGIVNEILFRPVKSSITSSGDTCESRMEVR